MHPRRPIYHVLPARVVKPFCCHNTDLPGHELGSTFILPHLFAIRPINLLTQLILSKEDLRYFLRRLLQDAERAA